MDSVSPFDYTVTFPNGRTYHVKRIAAVLILGHRFLETYRPNAHEYDATARAKAVLAAVDSTSSETAPLAEEDGLRITRYTPPA